MAPSSSESALPLFSLSVPLSERLCAHVPCLCFAPVLLWWIDDIEGDFGAPGAHEDEVSQTLVLFCFTSVVLRFFSFASLTFYLSMFLQIFDVHPSRNRRADDSWLSNLLQRQVEVDGAGWR